MTAQELATNSTFDYHNLDRRLALVEQSHVHMQKSLDAINDNTKKLVWIVMSAVILGTLKFVFYPG